MAGCYELGTSFTSVGLMTVNLPNCFVVSHIGADCRIISHFLDILCSFDRFY